MGQTKLGIWAPGPPRRDPCRNSEPDAGFKVPNGGMATHLVAKRCDLGSLGVLGLASTPGWGTDLQSTLKSPGEIYHWNLTVKALGLGVLAGPGTPRGPNHGTIWDIGTSILRRISARRSTWGPVPESKLITPSWALGSYVPFPGPIRFSPPAGG